MVDLHGDGSLQPPETLLSQFLDTALGSRSYVGRLWDGGGNIVLCFIQGLQNALKSSLLHTEVVLHTKNTEVDISVKRNIKTKNY